MLDIGFLFLPLFQDELSGASQLKGGLAQGITRMVGVRQTLN
jgi:hypothetical protein